MGQIQTGPGAFGQPGTVVDLAKDPRTTGSLARSTTPKFRRLKPLAGISLQKFWRSLQDQLGQFELCKPF